MVRLTRIYTRTGDGGTTALGNGTRVRKDHPRIEACGAVDELNAAIGLALAAGLDAETSEALTAIQNDLFDLGADLTVPQPRVSRGAGTGRRAALRMTAGHVAALERSIDRFNARMKPLSSFVLPGGSPASARLHQARTVCRRAERRLVSLARRERLNPQAIVYVNRLSDLLFVLGRHANDDGRNDVLWVPGRRLGEGG